MTLRKLKGEVPLLIMLSPAVVILLIYNYIPMFGIIIAFQDFNPALGFLRSQWVGLSNYKMLFLLPGTAQVLFNTVYIACGKIILTAFSAITFALLLNEVRKQFFKKFVQTITYMPYFLSWVILGGVLVDILSPSDGLLVTFLKAFGVSDEIFILGDNKTFPLVIFISEIWKNMGFSAIIYLAAITGIDQQQYEAAKIDGAGRWKQIVHITLPGMKSIIVLMMILNLGNVLNAGFDQIFNLYSPMVYESGDILDTMIYRIGLQQVQYSLATAMGFFKSVISLILTVVSYKIANKYSNYKVF